MADTDIETNLKDTGDKAEAAARRTAERSADAAKKGADTATDAVKSGIAVEHRSFAAAQDAGRQSAAAIGEAAQSSLKAGQEMARQSQDLARRAGDHAADLWRSSLTPMAHFNTEFTRWVEQFWRRSTPTGVRAGLGLPLMMLAPFTGHPAADLRQTEEGFELLVDLPGLTSDQIDLSLRGDMLVVSGDNSSESSLERGAYRFSERRVGSFERTFALPLGADRSNIEASFHNGVLKIDIPVLADGDPAQSIKIKG